MKKLRRAFHAVEKLQAAVARLERQSDVLRRSKNARHRGDGRPPTARSPSRRKATPATDCLQASQFLEQSLGVTVADQKTAEFYQDQQD